MVDSPSTTKQRIALLQEIAAKVAARLESHGIPASTAQGIGDDVATHLADDWGGQSLYFPMDMGARLSTRNTEIYSAFTGDNISELAQRFGLSVQCIYRIIRSERDRRAPKQSSLLNFTR
jgi:Mor family transcriptional regulator